MTLKFFPFILLGMSLSASLKLQLRDGFFRPLGRPSWPVYVDAGDRLLESSDEGGQLTREDTLALLRDVLGEHPSAELDADEGSGFSDARQRASQFYNRMLAAGWLQERPVSLGEYWVLVTPALRMLVRLLRDLAQGDLGELKDFAASLRSICEALLLPEALSPSRLEGAAMRQTVKDLLDRTMRAGDQMHAVETLIMREEAQQRQSATAGETLTRFLVDFHAGEHMVCYDALQESGLVPKLHEARRIAQEASSSALAKQRLAEGILMQKSLSSDDAYTEAEGMFLRLTRGLATIPIKQQIIDGRMADFSRLSAQRYRYQTEMRGRRPEQVKGYLDTASVLHEGRRFSDLDREPGMPLLCPHVGVYFGAVSFASARRARTPVALTLAPLSDSGDALTAQDIIRRHHLYVISPQRAARFITQHLPEKGARISTEDLGALPEDDFLDFLAVLAFERATDSLSRRSIRWRVTTERREHGLNPAFIPSDEINGWRVERVIVERML